MLSPLVLEGKTIRLSPLGEHHLQSLCDGGLEPRLWQATTIQVCTADEMQSYIATALDAQRAGTALPFIIEDRQAGQVIGSTRFHSYSITNKHVEIGFTWLKLPWQRTVANTEVKYLMLRHAFENLGCVRVEFRADSENQQSRKALARIGAVEEGVLRHCRISAHRGIRSLAVYSILREEWPRISADLKKMIEA